MKRLIDWIFSVPGLAPRQRYCRFCNQYQGYFNGQWNSTHHINDRWCICRLFRVAK